MGGMGQKLTTMLMRKNLLGPIGLSGLIAKVSWTHSYILNRVFHFCHLPLHPITHPYAQLSTSLLSHLAPYYAGLKLVHTCLEKSFKNA